MSTSQLLAKYNEFAPSRGVPTLKTWHDTRCKLVERLAILRTQKIVVVAPPRSARKRKRKPAKRKQPIRSAVLRLLSIVVYFEDTKTGRIINKRSAWRFNRRNLISVGLSYPECVARLRLNFPRAKVCGRDLRWTATKVRAGEPGFEKCILPQKRPHGGKRSQS
jgi:hypothetical protein